MIAPADAWGPFAPNLDTAEQRARLRSLRSIAHLTLGPRGTVLTSYLRRAETDPAALEPAVDALNRLASIDRRHVLATFATIHRPA